MGDTYRETALEQAVLSHGTIEIAMSMPHSNYRAPNDPAQVVKAAAVYERFLTATSPLVQLDGIAAKMATMLRSVSARYDDPDGVGAQVLAEYDQWKTANTPEEPF